MIRTRVAKHLFGENLYFGHRAIGDLLGHETMTGLVAMGVGGRRVTPEQRRVLDDLAVICNSSDPRIWPLKLTRLVGSFGGTVAAFCAGQLAVEGERIGYWITGYAAAGLVELRESVGDRLEDAAAVAREVRAFVARRGRVSGFGVPLRPSDERMDALRAYVRGTPLERGDYWRLQEALSDYVEGERGIPRNIGLGLAAVLLDLGYTPGEISPLAHFLTQNVYVANACEAAAQRSPEMQRVPDEHVVYAGPARRDTPRAAIRKARTLASSFPPGPLEYTDDGLPYA
jgi:hypothetical protein